MSAKRVITKLFTEGGPCGKVEVAVEQISRNKAQLTCAKCGAAVKLAMPGGRIDLTGFASLEDGVRRLHREGLQ